MESEHQKRKIRSKIHHKHHCRQQVFCSLVKKTIINTITHLSDSGTNIQITKTQQKLDQSINNPKEQINHRQMRQQKDKLYRYMPKLSIKQHSDKYG